MLLTCPLIEIFGLEDMASLKVEIILNVSEPFIYFDEMLSLNVTVGAFVSRPFNWEDSKTLL